MTARALSTPARRTAGALLLALIAVIVNGTHKRGAASAPRVAPPLPTLPLTRANVTLAKLHGHPVLVNFWASWCHPCQKEAPALAAFARGENGTQLVAVDTGDSPKPARAFIQRYGWTFPVLRDTASRAAERYRVVGLPTTFVLDARGRIVRTLTGPQDTATLRGALAAAGRG